MREAPANVETTPRPRLVSAQCWQIAAITGAALALFFIVRRLPTGTNLSHLDFRVNGGGSLEFCDPANPQFLPVVAVPSPVTMTLSLATAERGREQAFTLTLRTITGKAIGPEDLAVAHTRKLHLLVIDPSRRDYQHLHPEPGDIPGTWHGTLTPHRTGLYRVFADFVPVATGRGLYAVAEFTVASGAGAAAPPTGEQAGDVTADLPAPPEGYRFTLSAATPEVRAREVVDLTLAFVRADGGSVPLGPVMGAWAHLVAFDEQRLGFAHLHPNEIDLTRPPDAVHPRLTFKVTLPQPGRYVVWAQVNLAGRETFVPFPLTVR